MRFPDLSRWDRLAFDTETTGLTYLDRPVGISVAAPNGAKTYLRWGHEGGGNNCTVEEARRWAEAELNRPHLTLYAHNAAFDLRMLAYEGQGNHGRPGVGVRLDRPRVEDTGTMAALLNELEPRFSLGALLEKHVPEFGGKSDEELNAWCAERFGGRPTRRGQAKNYWRAPGDIVAPYAEDDALGTIRLAEALFPRVVDHDPSIRHLYDLETSLIPFHLRLHLQGVRVSRNRAERLKGFLNDEYKKAYRRWLDVTDGRKLNPRSPNDMLLLFEENGLPVAYTEKGNPSFSKDSLAGMNHPVVDVAQELKRLEHYRGTFVDSYLLDNLVDGRIHGEFHPLKNDKYGTVSGRYSSGGALNLQNIPSRDPVLGPRIRGCFVPEREGMRWAKIDYSQIEYRMFAHYAGGNLLEAYEDPDTDFHQMCADLAGIDRDPAKNTNFGLLFGMGQAKLGRQLGLSAEEAEEFFEMYHGRVPEMRRMRDKASRRAATRGYVVTWGGRIRRFRKRGRRYHATHIALNALCQGSAADLIKLAMSRVQDIVDWDHLIPHLTVHDELDFSVDPGAEGMRLLREVQDAMEDPGFQDEDPGAPFYKPRVPVVADVELGPDWGHLEEVEL